MKPIGKMFESEAIENWRFCTKCRTLIASQTTFCKCEKNVTRAPMQELPETWRIPERVVVIL